MKVVPVRVELLESDAMQYGEIRRNYDGLLWVRWPKPGDRFLWHASHQLVPPRRNSILRGPVFEDANTVVMEVEETKDGGIRTVIGMIRIQRTTDDPGLYPLRSKSLFSFVEPRAARQRWNKRNPNNQIGDSDGA